MCNVSWSHREVVSVSNTRGLPSSSWRSRLPLGKMWQMPRRRCTHCTIGPIGSYMDVYTHIPPDDVPVMDKDGSMSHFWFNCNMSVITRSTVSAALRQELSIASVWGIVSYSRMCKNRKLDLWIQQLFICDTSRTNTERSVQSADGLCSSTRCLATTIRPGS